MSIEKNIEDRQWFEEMIKDRGDHFWELCKERVLDSIEDGDPERMSRNEKVEFVHSCFPNYGRYANQRIADIPHSYLEFIGNTYHFVKKLNRYLRSCL